MSFRPTIAVRFGERIADIFYCRNWQEQRLLIEAAAIAVAYEDCRSVREYRLMAYGAEDISYIISPEVIPATQKNLKWLESCSELPLNVDLKARCIYCSYGALGRAELRKRPSMRLDHKSLWRTDFYRQLDRGRLFFRDADLEALRSMILKDRGMQELISSRTLDALRKNTLKSDSQTAIIHDCRDAGASGAVC